MPCHNNSWQLTGVLRSLHHQSVRPDMVVVVDDNSTPSEEKRLRSACRRLGGCYTRLPTPRNQLETLGRRSQARNVGTKFLDTDIILYLDGDMLLSPKYIAEVTYYHAVLDRVYIRGSRRSIHPAFQAKGMKACLNGVAKRHIPAETPALTYVSRPAHFIGDKAHKAAYFDKWEWCASNNLSVRSEHASQIGYWDEKFFGWGEEDIDFSYRLYQLGLTPILLTGDNAAAYHLDHHIDRERNATTLKANAKYLLSKFPEVAEYRREAYALHNIIIEECLQK